MQNNSLVIIGRLGSSHGVRGWQKLVSLTDPLDNIFLYKDHWQLQSKQKKLTDIQLENHKAESNQLLIKLKDINDCDQAKALTNQNIVIPKAILPTLQNNEHYWHELIGLKAINQQEVVLGNVDHLFATGSNDVLVITGGNKKHLLPYIDSIILAIDKEKNTILVDWDPDF